MSGTDLTERAQLLLKNLVEHGIFGTASRWGRARSRSESSIRG
jgi:hypothetical protein